MHTPHIRSGNTAFFWSIWLTLFLPVHVTLENFEQSRIVLMDAFIIALQRTGNNLYIRLLFKPAVQLSNWLRALQQLLINLRGGRGALKSSNSSGGSRSLTNSAEDTTGVDEKKPDGKPS